MGVNSSFLSGKKELTPISASSVLHDIIKNRQHLAQVLWCLLFKTNPLVDGRGFGI